MKVFRKKREKGPPASSSPWFRNLLPVLLGIGIGVLFLLGSSKGALAQEISSSSPRLQETQEEEGKGKESPAKIWQSYREFAQKGAWDKSRNELEKLYQGKLNQGIRNHNYYAIVLLRESAQLPKEVVEEMGPILLLRKNGPVFWSLLLPSPMDLVAPTFYFTPPGARGLVLAGGFYSYANLEESIPQYANLRYGFVSAFDGAQHLWLVLAFRYYTFFHHHLRHLLNLDFHRSVEAVWGCSLLLHLLGIGWLGMFLAWLWLLDVRKPGGGQFRCPLVLVLLLPSAVRVFLVCFFPKAKKGSEIIRATTGCDQNSIGNFSTCSSARRATRIFSKPSVWSRSGWESSPKRSSIFAGGLRWKGNPRPPTIIWGMST
jgi:hypothetical protein